MTWTLFSRSIGAGVAGVMSLASKGWRLVPLPDHLPPHPTLSPRRGEGFGGLVVAFTASEGLRSDSLSRCLLGPHDLLADPLHVAVHRDLAELHDLAALDGDEPRAVGGPMVLARVREGRGDPPRIELLQALEPL